jgi:PAS domain S-box-containing protein
MEHKVMQLKKWKEKIGGNPGLIIIGAFVILSILAAADHLFNLPRFFFGAPLESFEWEELVFDVIAIFSIGWISFVLIRKSEAGRGKIEQVFQIQRDLSLSLSGVTDLKEGLSLCLEAALDLSGMDSGGIYLLEQTTGSLNLAFHKGLSSDFVKVVSHYEAESPNVRLVMQGNPVYAQYQKIDLILTETERNEGLLALAVIPIKHESKIIGCFNIASRSAEEIPYFARQSLEMIAEQTGSSIARLRMEKELHESEERFRQFSENIEQVFWLTDWDAKRLLFVNPAFERLYGRSCQSAYDNRMNWQDVIHPEDRDRVRQAFARSADLGQYVEAEYRVVRDDGIVSWVLDRSYPVRDKDGRIYRFASVAEDITERKQTEEALRESEEKYKALIEAAGRAGEGIIIVQDNGDGEAAFVFVNDEFCRMSGYSREELLGRSAWGLVPAEVSIRLKDWYKRRHMGESLPGHYEAAGIRKDGAVVPLDLSIVTMPWQGKIATVLYLRDITERKKAEEEIRAERDKLENVTRNIGVGLAIISKDYRTIWANEVLKQIFGEVEGKLCFQTYNLREDICPGCGVKEVFEKEKDVSVHEQVGRDKDGNTIWSQIIATPLKDKEGNITAAMEVVVPITERKKAEEAQKESEERYRNFFENAPLGIYRTTPDGQILLANPALIRMLGFSSLEELAQRNLEKEGFEPQYRREEFKKHLEKEGEVQGLEAAWVRSDGSTIFVRENARAVKKEDGSIQYYEGMVEDITEHKKAEEALRSSEERHRLLFERNLAGVFRGTEDGKMLDCNESVVRMFGYDSKEELLSHQILDVYPEKKEREKFLSNLMKQKVLINYEVCFKRKDGSLFWGIENASLLEDKDQGYSIIEGTLIDITERKKAEELLRESEEKFRNLAEHLPSMVFINKKGKVVYVNRRCEEVMGYKKEEIYSPDFDFFILIAPEFRDLISESYQRHLNGQQVDSLEYTLMTRDGQKIEAIITTNVIAYQGETAILGIITDITEHKKAEEALRTSEEKYRAIVENATDQIFTLDRQCRFLAINKTAAEISRKSPDEMIGKSLTQIFPGETADQFSKNIEEVFESGKSKFTEEKMLVQGKEFYNSTTLNPIKDDKGNVIAVTGIVRDITERKRAEEEIKNLARFPAENPDPVLRISKDGIILYANDRSLSLLREWRTSVNHPAPSHLRQLFTEVFNNGSTRNIEIEHAGRILSFIVVPITGTDYINLYGRDITERKKAEEAVRESEQRYRGVVDNIGIGVSLISPNMKILFLNEQMKKWFPNADLSKEAICYRAFNSPPKEEICSYCPTDKTLHDGQIHESITETPVEGKIINYRVISSPIKDLQGKVTAAIEMVEDITEKKRLQEQLIQSEKLAAVGTLAYGIAHEFNNILAGMMANAELGLISKEQEQIKECFEIIVDNSHRASSITSNLLAFARQKEARKELIDITEPLKSILAITRRELEKCNIEIIEKFKLVPKIYCDPGQFSEVFLNMITNARDAMHPKGGTLTIQVEPGDDNIHIVFEDTGCGIPEEIKGKIFEPFVTTKGALGKSEVPGTGLGLFLTYGIVNGYKGKIEVESVVGKGTRFSIIIPIAENQPREFLLDTQIESSRETEKKLKILLVDDEKAITLGLKKFLESKGHKVSTSLRAKGGLEIFRKGRFDLVLSDITIPDMDGIELIKKMKENDQQVKIIVITGHLQKEKEEKARQAGADEVLIKPFKNELLYQTISKIVI